MYLPYVIDNRAHTLADVLNDLLRSDAVHTLDVATAYVNVGAFDLASLRLLLGSEPGAGDLSLPQALRHDLGGACYKAFARMLAVRAASPRC
jgi:hypothetical protein